MRSTQILTALALVATSVSGMSIGHGPYQPAHRRHGAAVAHGSIHQARSARQPSVPEPPKRRDFPPRRVHVRKRASNQRRCAASQSTSSELPLSTDPAPEVSTTSSKAKYHSTTMTTSEETTKATTTKEAQSTTTTEAETTTKATKTSTSATPTSTSSGSGSSSGSTHTGEGTYYATGLGACGITNVDTDYICAVSQSLFDGFDGYTGSNPNSNPICNKKLTATYQGKSVTVTATDRCTGCAMNDLDFSPTAFEQLADQSVGRLTGLTWKWEE